MKAILLFSGPTAVGKSEVSKILTKKYSFQSLGSGAFLRDYATTRGLDESRGGLQQLGDLLDDQTDYRWIVEDVALPNIHRQPEHNFWLVDSVRKERQVQHFRDAFGKAVLHVHFTASEETLRKRYEERAANGNEYSGNTSYSAAQASPNEIAARSLEKLAEFSLDLTTAAPQAAADAILARMKY